MSGERGFTLIELMVSMAISLLLGLAIFGVVDATSRSSARVAHRVEANQLARPVLQHVMDELYSSCVAPGVTPIIAGSDGSSVSFLHQTGTAASVTPDERVLTLAGGALSESVYPATGGTAPSWTFAAAPSSTRQLLTGVGAASAGSPPSALPLFQYYAYTNGQLQTTPLSVPLSPSDAARAVQITVSFSVSPGRNPIHDPNAAISVSDSVQLRFTPAGESVVAKNLPCS